MCYKCHSTTDAELKTHFSFNTPRNGPVPSGIHDLHDSHMALPDNMIPLIGFKAGLHGSKQQVHPCFGLTIFTSVTIWRAVTFAYDSRHHEAVRSQEWQGAMQKILPGLHASAACSGTRSRRTSASARNLHSQSAGSAIGNQYLTASSLCLQEDIVLTSDGMRAAA